MPVALVKSQRAQKNAPETNMAYAARNIKKIPSQAYKTVRSGLGGGDVIDELTHLKPLQDSGISQLFDLLSSIPGSPLGAFRPYEQAEQEAKSAYGMIGANPETAVTRPEDYWPEFLISALATAPKTVLGLGKDAALAGVKHLGTSLGVLGGAELGGYFGESLGEEFGVPKTGRFVGGGAGGAAAGLGINRLLNRHTNVVTPEELAQAEEEAFNADRRARAQAVEDEYTPKVQEHEENLRNVIIKSAEEKEQYSKGKENKVKALREKVEEQRAKKDAYEQKISDLESQASDLYNESKVDSAQKGEGGSLAKSTNKVKKNLATGLAEGESGAIGHYIDQIDSMIEKNTGKRGAKKGKTSLRRDEVNTIKKGINEEAHKKTTDAYGKETYKYSKNARAKFKQLTKGLDKFLESSGSEEQSAAYKKAQKLTAEKNKLISKRPKFIKDTDKSIKMLEKKASQAKEGSFSPVRSAELEILQDQAKDMLKSTLKEKNELLSGINKESYKKFVADKASQNTFMNQVTGNAKGLTGWGAGASGLVTYLMGLGSAKAAAAVPGGALLGYVAKTAYNEFKACRKIAKDHPQVTNRLMEVVRQADKHTPAQTVAALNQIGQDMKRLSEGNKSTENKGKAVLVKSKRF